MPFRKLSTMRKSRYKRSYFRTSIITMTSSRANSKITINNNNNNNSRGYIQCPVVRKYPFLYKGLKKNLKYDFKLAKQNY